MNTQSLRPKIIVPPSRTDTVLELVSMAGVAMLILITAKYWPVLPERIPSHSGFNGQVDAWGPKSGILFFPVAGLLMYALITIVSRFPWIFNYPVPITAENVERQYRIAVSAIRWLKAESIFLFAYIEWQTIRVALGRAQGMGWGAMVLLAAITATLLAMIVQARRAR